MSDSNCRVIVYYLNKNDQLLFVDYYLEIEVSNSMVNKLG